MKQWIIGSLVGALLIFTWQFASWTFLNLHHPQQKYTPHQDTILAFLSEHLGADGGFYLPSTPKRATMEEQQALMEQSIGKPWAQVFYHKAMKDNMNRNMLRGVLINLVVVLLFMWVLQLMQHRSFRSILLASLAVGLIVFFNEPYTTHIWFETFDLNASLVDALVSWGLVGIWLGWWMKKEG
ncbi:MAG TPA: hypothetical protein PKE63_03065 [Lacibacter sp.]|nr:hypothetical protein [Lacibacter sp.]HMO87737.1 hypothetical protein [Lacibacter sp.]HMP86227.1 hypothetical protein [Lacibacter sp.]